MYLIFMHINYLFCFRYDIKWKNSNYIHQHVESFAPGWKFQKWKNEKLRLLIYLYEECSEKCMLQKVGWNIMREKAKGLV